MANDATSNGRRKRKMLEGSRMDARYQETYDVEMKTASPFPTAVDRDLILRFLLPSSPLLHIDFKNSSIFAQISVERMDGTAPKPKDVFSVVSEPVLSMIRRVTVYSLGRVVFSSGDYQWRTLVNRYMQDQSMLDSTAHYTSGYGRDTVPFNVCNKELSAQQFRSSKLKFGIPWSLRSQLPLAPFGTWSPGDQPLIPSTLGLSVEIEFNSSDWCLFRSPKKEESPEPLRLMLNDFKLITNLKVLVQPIPRNKMTTIKIPHHNEELFTFQGVKGSYIVSSGQFSMPNHPSKAIVFISKANAESQFQNPMEMLSHSTVEMMLTVNGRDHIQTVDSTLGEYIGAYYQAVRTMAPDIGRFALDRDTFPYGFFFLGMNLSRMGKDSLDRVDVMAPRSASILSASLKFDTPLPENVEVHLYLQSLGKTMIHEADNSIDIDLI